MAVTRKTKGDRVFDVVNFIILLLICLIVAYPLYFVIIASISDPNVVNKGGVIFWPQGATLLGYQKLFQDQTIWRGYANTFFYTLCGTVLDVVVTTCAAYALSRKDLVGRKGLMRYFIFTMYFSGGLIPLFIQINKMGLYNTRWVLILLGTVSVYNLIIARTFFETSVPGEIYEAASIDGSGNLETYFKIALPLAKPIIAVMVIFTMVGYWNDWYQALIYMNDKAKYPLQLALRQILIQSQAMTSMMGNMDGGYAEANKIKELIKFASIVVGSVPMLIAYPFVQKYFEKGFTVGAVKG